MWRQTSDIARSDLGSSIRERKSVGHEPTRRDSSPRIVPDERVHGWRSPRRAYYRVEGMLPIRLTRLDEADVDAAIFDLSLPDPLLQPIKTDSEDEIVLMERLQRIEEKLDLLLGAAKVDVPRGLSGRDRQSVVFSGAGLALDVSFAARAGEAFKVEILLAPPYGRTLRAVSRVVSDTCRDAREGAPRKLALSLDHMDDEERDVLVAYSYDLQRFALRTRAHRDTPLVEGIPQ